MPGKTWQKMVAGPEAGWSHDSHPQETEGEQEVCPGSRVSSPDFFQ